MPQLIRNTKVVSLSLEPGILKSLDYLRRKSSQTRSAAIAKLIRQETLLEEFNRLREYGRKKALELNIQSEEDVYRIMGDA
ncbi:hypothetical protein HYS82_02495 [Candidatus Amesbacteria bacterium]|nr:hypothetical protein [Candidatus Amesbacteria bacterium]